MRGGFLRTPRFRRAWPALIVLPWCGLLALGTNRGVSAASPEIDLKLPADILYQEVAGEEQAVVFSHVSHAAFVDNQCMKCHPQTFPMLQRGPAPTHEKMNDGGSCGVCHDGKGAFDVEDDASCTICHTGPPAPAAPEGSTTETADGAAPAKKLPAPHVYPPGESSPGPVTFRHETHSQGGCTTCHSKLFRMAAAPPLPDGGMHEAGACGACHDGTKSFGVEDSDACMRCHIENGARP